MSAPARPFPLPPIHVLIPAAGGGTRMATGTGNTASKLMLPVGGVPVLLRTLRTFLRHPGIDRVLLVVADKDRDQVLALCEKEGCKTRVDLAAGGPSRQESVRRGLEVLSRDASDDDLVLIQDGARCFTDTATIDRCIAEALASGACCAAMPLKDTIKETDAERIVVGTPDRTRYWQIQTPQAFRFGLIREAYRMAHEKSVTATDDASLAEAAGHPVRLVEGSYLNIKITTPDDLLFGEAIAAEQDRTRG